MVDIPFDTVAGIPPAEVGEVELYHPRSWWTRYVFSQDAKVIAIQYSITAMSIGMVALVLSWLMRLQLGFPGTFSFIDPNEYLQFITMHGMIMVIYLLTALFLGGFGNYLIPLMVGARDMVFPYVNMLSYWVYLLAVAGAGLDLLRAGRAHRRRLDALSAPGHSFRHPRAGLGHHSHAGLADPVHHRLHHGRAELRRDGAAGTHTRHDVDAHAPDGVGHLHGHRHGAAGVPGPVRRFGDAAARSPSGHQLLHADARRDGPADRNTAAAARSCSSTCSGSSAIPRSTSSRCRPSASFPI